MRQPRRTELRRRRTRRQTLVKPRRRFETAESDAEKAVLGKLSKVTPWLVEEWRQQPDRLRPQRRGSRVKSRSRLLEMRDGLGGAPPRKSRATRMDWRRSTPVPVGDVPARHGPKRVSTPGRDDLLPGGGSQAQHQVPVSVNRDSAIGADLHGEADPAYRDSGSRARALGGVARRAANHGAVGHEPSDRINDQCAVDGREIRDDAPIGTVHDLTLEAGVESPFLCKSSRRAEKVTLRDDELAPLFSACRDHQKAS